MNIGQTLTNAIGNAVADLSRTLSILKKAAGYRDGKDEQFNKLYGDLVEIASDSQITEEEKIQKRIVAYSIAYQCDEQKAALQLRRDCRCENYIPSLKNHIDKLQELNWRARINDIFGADLPEASDVNKFYIGFHKNLDTHLHTIETNDFKKITLEEFSVKMLRCGFISTEENRHALVREMDTLVTVVKNTITGIFALVDELQSWSGGMREDEAKADSQTKRTMRVTTEALMKILIKAGLPTGKVNNKDIADLISCITGFNRESIRQELSNTSKLPYGSREEVEKINGLLAKLKLEISMTYDETNRKLKD